MNYQYKTVPFRGVVDKTMPLSDRDNPYANKIATNLTKLINQNAQDGWEFYQINNVSTIVSAGCLATLVGVKSHEQRFDMLIFRKSIGNNNSNDQILGQTPLDLKESSSINESNIRKSGSEINNSAIYRESYSDLNDAIKMLEFEGFKIVKILDISSVLSGKEYRISKGRKIQDCSGDEIIKYANEYIKNQMN